MSIYGDTREHAENKVLLLYLVHRLRMPASSMQLTRILLENRFTNYFLLQQSLYELCAEHLLSEVLHENTVFYTLTPEGEGMLTMFRNILPAGMVTRLDEHIDEIRSGMKRETSVLANYQLLTEDEYLVHCRILEDDSPLVDLRVPVGSREDARRIVRNWKDNAVLLYPELLNLLLREKQDTSAEPDLQERLPGFPEEL